MKCSLPDGMEARIDGHDIDPCLYEEVETIEHCTVHVLQCTKCGHIEIMWERENDD